MGMAVCFGIWCDWKGPKFNPPCESLKVLCALGLTWRSLGEHQSLVFSSCWVLFNESRRKKGFFLERVDGILLTCGWSMNRWSDEIIDECFSLYIVDIRCWKQTKKWMAPTLITNRNYKIDSLYPREWMFLVETSLLVVTFPSHTNSSKKNYI